MKWTWLILVFLVVLGVRLFFAFQTPFFTSDTAYLQSRIVEQLAVSPNPLITDYLGWGGRFLVANIFHYILAFFTLFIPKFLVLKIIPNLFASLTVFPVFLIVKQITKKNPISLFCAFLSAFVPVFFIQTFNHISTISLVIPLFFFLIYSWMRIPSVHWVITYVFGIILFAFLHPFSIVFVLGLLFYIIFSKLEGLKISVAELELLLFSICFVFWAQFLLYKNIILFHGFKVIWQNIPFALLSEHFFRLPIWGVVLQIGLFPLIVGIYVLYKLVFRTKSKDVYLFFGFACLFLILLWLQLIELFYALMLIGIVFIILLGRWLVMFDIFLKKTKIAKIKSVLFFSVLFLILASSLIPVYVGAKKELDNTISFEENEAFNWIKENTSPEDSIVAPVNFGHYIPAFAERSTVIDSVFLLQTKSEERFNDVRKILSSVLETDVVSLMDKYDAKYVLFADGKESVVFKNKKCFELEYDNSVKIFKKRPLCRLKVVE